jgi:hypothetical protein
MVLSTLAVAVAETTLVHPQEVLEGQAVEETVVELALVAPLVQLTLAVVVEQWA